MTLANGDLDRLSIAEKDHSGRGDREHSRVGDLHLRADDDAATAKLARPVTHAWGDLEAEAGRSATELAQGDFLHQPGAHLQVNDLVLLRHHMRIVERAQATAVRFRDRHPE